LGISEVNGHSLIRLSARTGEGVDVLRNHLKQSMGFDTNMEGGFLARRRHLQALSEAASHLQQGKAQLLGAWAGELLAEELRLSQQALSEITGEFTSDDLLGRIFSSFCIGK
jgi:tRNA modification GTPase